ncbi:HelD family protein [Clostridium rectalis]|uniref:HelD family protein n=1 Tax=Clostridium rectalis TaxID=2040295 RepID=UPI000F63E70A|nr:UvrD-helicase domain-containing protein [Clostridium rectalis]
MSINKQNMMYEEKYLQDTLIWIENEMKKSKNDNDKLKEKIEQLRKQAKGKYNQELETCEKLYKITSRNFNKYCESIKAPYFARIDFKEYKREEESFYIGKFGLGDITTGDEKVIDWRSPIADLYYSGTFGETYYKAPIGVISGNLNLKRKFIIKDKVIIDAFDEGINEIILKGTTGEENVLSDEFLKINLEESVSNKLKDVVATIQKEQNFIIRCEKNEPLIVQGSAGSGKTTVALHRIAYLVYKYKESLKAKEILIIAPNKIFLEFISQVLPNLGVDHINQVTYEEIVCKILNIKGKILTKDSKLAEILEGKLDNIHEVESISKIKGSWFFKELIDKYINYLEKEDCKRIKDIKAGNYLLFEKKEIERLFTKDLINMSLNQRKDEIKRYLNLKIDEKIANIIEKINFYYEYKVARVKKVMEDSIERRKKLINIYDERDLRKKEIKIECKKEFNNYFDVWKEVDSGNLYIDFLNYIKLQDNNINNVIIDRIIKTVKENKEIGVVDSEDLAPRLYLKFKVQGLENKYLFKHIVVDEAQDYNELELWTIKKLVQNNSMTIVGDLAQGIYYYKGIENWESVIKREFDGAANYINLEKSYRSTIEIIDFASRVLEKQNINIKPSKAVLRHGDTVKVQQIKTYKDFCERVDEIVSKVLNNGRNNIAIIGKTLDECKKIHKYLRKYSENQWQLVKNPDKYIEKNNIIIPSYMTKGLEFDCSIIYDCSNTNYKNSELNKKILYTVLTRALHYEFIFYFEEISELIK